MTKKNLGKCAQCGKNMLMMPGKTICDICRLNELFSTVKNQEKDDK